MPIEPRWDHARAPGSFLAGLAGLAARKTGSAGHLVLTVSTAAEISCSGRLRPTTYRLRPMDFYTLIALVIAVVIAAIIIWIIVPRR